MTPILDAPSTFPLWVPPPKDFPWLCLLPAPATRAQTGEVAGYVGSSHVLWFTVQGTKMEHKPRKASLEKSSPQQNLKNHQEGRDMAGWGGDGLPNGTGKWVSKWTVGQGALGGDAAGFPLGLLKQGRCCGEMLGGWVCSGEQEVGEVLGALLTILRGRKIGGGQPLPRWRQIRGKVGIRGAMGREVEPNGLWRESGEDSGCHLGGSRGQWRTRNAVLQEQAQGSWQLEAEDWP